MVAGTAAIPSFAYLVVLHEVESSVLVFFPNLVDEKDEVEVGQK